MQLQNEIQPTVTMLHQSVDAQVDLVERLKIFRIQEESSYRCCPYFSESSSSSSSSLGKSKLLPKPTPKSRKTIIDWCYEVIDFYGYDPMNVSITLNYLDRYLGTEFGSHELQDINTFQLAAMTSFYLAIKINDPKEMSMRLLTQISRGLYTSEQFIQMEMQILTCLKWKVNPPTATHFLELFMELLMSSYDIHPELHEILSRLNAEQVKKAGGQYKLISCNPSIIALSAMLNSLEVVSPGQFSSLKSSELWSEVFPNGKDHLKSDEVINVRRRLKNYICCNEPCDFSNLTIMDEHSVSQLDELKNENEPSMKPIEINKIKRLKHEKIEMVVGKLHKGHAILSKKVSRFARLA